MNKKILALLLALVALVSVPSAVAGDRPITFERLPQAAQQFVKKHFASYQISIVKLDEELLEKSYDIIFTDGTKIEFDRKGNWQDIDSKHSAVPASVIPAQIANYLSKHHPNEQVRQIERTRRRGYQVELSSGADLVFDSKYRFVGFDD